jgi:hypothetical protein
MSTAVSKEMIHQLSQHRQDLPLHTFTLPPGIQEPI